nr:hypothetical protein [uncultured Psychroserpens sp.]
MIELQAKNQSISKEIDVSKSLNFKSLREKGIDLIGRFSGEVWTDYNVHDPGITILEALCYSLADIGLRVNLDIRDLLVPQKESKFSVAGMFPIKDILPASPLTKDDYRKLLIDIPGIRNAWLEKESPNEPLFYFDSETEELTYSIIDESIKVTGLYEVLLEFDRLEIEGELNFNIYHVKLPEINGTVYSLDVTVPYWDQLPSFKLEDLNINSAILQPIPGGGGDTISSEGGNYYQATIELNYDNGMGQDVLVADLLLLNELVPADETQFLTAIANTLVNISSGSILDIFVLRSNAAKKLVKISEERLRIHRNIGEDFLRIRTARTQEIALRVNIEIHSSTDVEQLWVDIFWAVSQFLSPYIPRYSLEELIEQKQSLDSIFEGPLLENGFIRDIDLERNHKLDINDQNIILYTSDLIRIIMDVIDDDGTKPIIGVRNLSLSNYINNLLINSNVRNCMKLTLSRLYKPRLSRYKSDIRFIKDGMLIEINEDRIDKLLEQKRLNNTVQTKKTNIPSTLNGSPLVLGDYYSFQHDFPQVYGLGKGDLSKNAPQSRLGKANQLKAYLSFFDQVLADALAQLSKQTEIFSIDSDIEKSYFSQPIFNIPEISTIINNQQDYLEALAVNSEDKSTFYDRRNRVLDHILARFSETFQSFESWYLNYASEDPDASLETIQTKTQFLQCYPELSKNRMVGYNYKGLGPSLDVWNTDNVSGLQKRISKMAGIKSFDRRHFFPESEPGNFFSVSVDPGGDFLEMHNDNTPGGVLLLSSITDPAPLTLMDKIMLNGQFKKKYHRQQDPISKQFKGVLLDDLDIEIAYTPEFLNEQALKDHINSTITFLHRTYSAEGFYMIEHLLLRPRVQGNSPATSDALLPLFLDNSKKPITDPYSFRLTFIFPSGYSRDFSTNPIGDPVEDIPERFRDLEFRAWMEKTIYNEAPAHMMINIFWVDRDSASPITTTSPSINNFSRVYEEWLEGLANETLTIASQHNFIEIISKIINRIQD